MTYTNTPLGEYGIIFSIPNFLGMGSYRLYHPVFPSPAKKQTGNETSVSSGPRVCTLVVFILF